MHQITKTTMTYALRLPPTLDASAHRHADYLGLSFNGFVCVAVEAYLRANPVLSLPVGLPDPPANSEASLPSMGGKSDLVEPVSRPVDTPVPAPLPDAFELVQQVIPKPETKGKSTGKKESFKDRQRARDTAFR